jgi:8-oxo-dGTP pyrophosphatase MutT (NUDIX family)
MPQSTDSPTFSCDAIARRLASFDRQAAAAGSGLKHAAVALVLAGDPDDIDGAALLLTERAAGLRAHARQFAFPGGRCDPGESAEQAALRELHEELGLNLPAGAIVGLLDDYATRSGYVMTPVVVWAGRDPALAPNPAEVGVVHHVSLRDLLLDSAVEWLPGVEPERPIIRLKFGDRAVHAPTGAILYQFLEVALRGRLTRVGHIDQPAFAWR